MNKKERTINYEAIKEWAASQDRPEIELAKIANISISMSEKILGERYDRIPGFNNRAAIAAAMGKSMDEVFPIKE